MVEIALIVVERSEVLIVNLVMVVGNGNPRVYDNEIANLVIVV